MKWPQIALAAGLAALMLSGCGGSGVSNASVTGPGGCGGVFSGGSFTIAYGERTRALTSALSGKAVIKNAAADGSDVVVTFNRNSTLAAHSETYAIPTLKTISTTASVTLYAGPDQTGDVVGTASATETISCSGLSFTNITTAAKVATVSVTPATLTVGGASQQLIFTAKDSTGTVLAVTPGSAMFATTGSVATVTKDGIATPVSAGTESVTATVDGVTSPPATVTVNSAGCGGVFTGGTFSVKYGARTRAGGLSSALSGKLVITGAAATGGDAVVRFNRNAADLTAHTESYNLPDLKTMSTTATLTLYGDYDQSGSVVGTATGADVITCTGTSFDTTNVNAAITKVVVSPLSLSVGGSAQSLSVSATDASNAPVVVSAGSVTYAHTGTHATVDAYGTATPVSAGTDTVTATIDGVTSAPASITVTGTSTGFGGTLLPPPAGLSYTVGVALASDGTVVGNAVSSDSFTQIAAQWSPAGTETDLVGTSALAIDDSHNVVTHNSSNGNDLWYAAGSSTGSSFPKLGSTAYQVKQMAPNGSALGQNSGGGWGWWLDHTTTPVPLLDLADGRGITAYAVSGSTVVGFSFQNGSNVTRPVYWTPGVDGSAHQMQGPTDGAIPRVISTDGRVAGTANNVLANSNVIYYWSSVTAAPQAITFAAGTDMIPAGINNTGTILAFDRLGGGFFTGKAGGTFTQITATLPSGYSIDSVEAINNSGQVLVNVSNGTTRRAALLTPTP